MSPRRAARTYLVSVAGPLMSLVLSAVGFAVLESVDPHGTARELIGIFAAAQRARRHRQPAARTAARRGPRPAGGGVAGHRLGGQGHPGRRPRRPCAGGRDRGRRAGARLASRACARAATRRCSWALILGAYLWSGASTSCARPASPPASPTSTCAAGPPRHRRDRRTRRWPRRYDGPTHSAPARWSSPTTTAGPRRWSTRPGSWPRPPYSASRG